MGNLKNLGAAASLSRTRPNNSAISGQRSSSGKSFCSSGASGDLPASANRSVRLMRVAAMRGADMRREPEANPGKRFSNSISSISSMTWVQATRQSKRVAVPVGLFSARNCMGAAIRGDKRPVSADCSTNAALSRRAAPAVGTRTTVLLRSLIGDFDWLSSHAATICASGRASRRQMSSGMVREGRRVKAFWKCRKSCLGRTGRSSEVRQEQWLFSSPHGR